jgi:hypothetical protein
LDVISTVGVVDVRVKLLDEVRRGSVQSRLAPKIPVRGSELLPVDDAGGIVLRVILL